MTRLIWANTIPYMVRYERDFCEMYLTLIDENDTFIIDRRKSDFCVDAKTKALISSAVTAKLISAFIFATRFNTLSLKIQSY